jgi:hypothetical protein
VSTFTSKKVTLELPIADFELLLLMMGIAIGAAWDNKPMARSFVRLTNRLNKDNPNFQPYKIPGDKDANLKRA